MIGKRLILAGCLLAMGFGAFAQAPGPSPAQRELEAPLVLDDGKPTQGTVASSAGPSAWRTLGSLVVVLGLAGGSLYAFRKWGAGKLPGSGGTRLRVEETLALGDRRFVSILRVDEERFLIALSPGGLSLMTRLDNVEAGGPAEFSEALDRQVNLNAPMAVKDMEAMIRREQA